MKKIFFIMIMILFVTASACKNSSEDWKLMSGLYEINEEHVVECYVNYAQSEAPLVEVEEKVLEAYRTKYPELFNKMEKPIPMRIEGEEENVILFSDEKGNVLIAYDESPFTIIGTLE